MSPRADVLDATAMHVVCETCGGHGDAPGWYDYETSTEYLDECPDCDGCGALEAAPELSATDYDDGPIAVMLAAYGLDGAELKCASGVWQVVHEGAVVGTCTSATGAVLDAMGMAVAS